MMTARFGDADLNGLDEQQQQQRRASQLHDEARRRFTRQFGPTAAAAATDTSQQQFVFKEFSRNSLAAIQRRKLSRAKRYSVANAEAAAAVTASASNKQRLEPDPYLASGVQLPQYILRRVPPELIGRPIEDIDPYYADKETFVIISRGKELIRFSANKALYLFGPFHPIRRIVLYILVSSVFNLFVILTILINCILMTIQGSEVVERTIEETEIVFTIIYTFEFMLKVMARGFLFGEFAYLRDPWNILDVTVITLSYLTIVIQDLGNLSVMRTFRVLRALKTVAVVPGMKTIVGAVIDSVKNLKDVVVLTLFSLSVFSLLGLQIYMGSLTQKCILNGPSNMNDTQWLAWNSNSSNWLLNDSNGGGSEGAKGASSSKFNYKLCGNSTGAQTCPPERTCLQGFGPNPDFGFTNFDTFGWSLICSFRLMTQDYWEGLYMQILKTSGSWHMIFFIVSIFLGSIYLMNLILAIVAMSYNELQRRAEEEEEANMEDEAAFLESCRLMELQEQGSQYSGGRNSQLGMSYRPSLEIGLVGQSLLASFCQNGLLDERTREKLDQQMAFSPLPGKDAASGGRSRSLCLNHHLNPVSPAGGGSTNQWMQYGILNPYSATNRHSIYQQRELMATSLNELSRRKSSIRTHYNGGETGMQSPKTTQPASRNGSLVGQRRLMRDISISQLHNNHHHHHSSHQLNGSLLLRRKSRLATHHLSSNVLMPCNYNYTTPQQQINNNHHQTGPVGTTRSSIISDKDLQILKQKAAKIRIGETFRRLGSREFDEADPDSLLSINDNPHQTRSASMQISRRRTGSSLLSATQLDQLTLSSTESTMNPNRRQPPVGYKSETAICEQPSGAYPLGRMAANALDNLTNLSSASLSPQRQPILGRSSPRQRRSGSDQRRRSTTASQRRTSGGNGSATSYRRSLITLNISDRQSLASAPVEPREKVTKVCSSPTASGQSRRQQQLSPHRQSINNVQGGGQPLPLSQSGNKSCSLRTLRGSTNHQLNLAPDSAGPEQDQMRYLSVENFQQFGGLRSLQPTRPSSTSTASRNQPSDLLKTDDDDDGEFRKSPLHSKGKGSIKDEMRPQTLLARRQSLQRQHQCLDGARFSIQPPPKPSAAASCSMTRTRNSFSSRLRHSMLPTGYAAPTAEQQRQLQQLHYYNDRPPVSSQIRRLSRDFVRHADGWSRLSMSGNVDLRRLLRLWSHSNPYKNRPSIGSSSLYSQTSQTSQQRQRQTKLDAFSSSFNKTRGQLAPSSVRNSDAAGPLRASFATSPLRQPLSRFHYDGGSRSPLGSQTWQAYEVLSAVNGRQNRYQSDARAYGTSLPLDDNLAGHNSDEMSISARDKCLAYCLSCLDILCIWECCECWIRIQRLIALVVFDPFTELFILLCILINTLFMALDNDDVDDQMRRLFEQSNYFFTATFVVEAVMKIIALSPKFYFREGFNVFDAIIVGLSLLELGLEGVYGLSVLRTFRLLRVFRLARSWPTMNVLISICGHAISDLGNLTFVLAIIVFIFAVMGMQLFGNKYTASSFADGVVPRWNFNDFMHSFMIVFRILCAEWIEPLWDCMNAAPKEICIPFFISAVIIGNLVLLNLFLALLLASFGSSNLSGPQADHVDTRKLQEAIGRFKRFGRFSKRLSTLIISRLTDWILCRCWRKRKRTNLNELDQLSSMSGKHGKRIKSHIATMSRQERQQNIERRTEELKSMIRRSPEHHFHLNKLARDEQVGGRAQMVEIQLEGEET